MRIDLPRCNFKNCHWCQDGNCYKKTRDYCEYHCQNTEIERLQDLIKEAQQYNEAWVEDNGKLRKEIKTIKADAVRKMRDMLSDKALNKYPYVGYIDVFDVEKVARELLEENNG